VLESNRMNEQFVFFPAGSALVLYTDGVTEARDAEGRQYGLARLAEHAMTEALANSSLSASHLLHALRADLPNNANSSQDDQAILIIAAR
jgi:serine phosphatase RsbU (regulator of sigma subunit)